MRALVLAAVLLLCSSQAMGFYLPGVAPQDFKQVGSAVVYGGCTAFPMAWTPSVIHFVPPQNDVIFFKVNKLSSVKTQLPYEYYSLPYCRPEKIVPFAENLGEVLRGDRIENSLYQVGPCVNCRLCGWHAVRGALCALHAVPECPHLHSQMPCPPCAMK